MFCTDDATPPEFLSYGAGGFTKTSFEISASLNKTGTYFYLVYPGTSCALLTIAPTAIPSCTS